MHLPFFLRSQHRQATATAAKADKSITTLPAGAKGEHKNSGYAVVPRIASFLAYHADCH